MSGETSGSDITETIGHVSVKHLPFYHKSPEVWFLQMESQFALAKIKCTTVKYHHILAALPVDIACNLSIGTEQDYEKLKGEVLNSLRENKHSLIEKALSAVELGDRRPTQLVTEIKRRFTDIGLPIDDNIIKSRLLSALPCHIRSALVGHDSVSVDQYAAIADSMLAVAGNQNHFVGAVRSNGQASSNSPRHTGQQRQNNKFFPPRPFFEGQRPRVCNSHIYWGSKARNCRHWCHWPDKPKHILKDNEKTPRNSRPSTPENS